MARTYLGSVLHALGRHQESLAELDSALLLDPDDFEAHFNRGAALHALGRYNEAITSYLAAERIDPDIPVLQHNLGLAFQAAGRPTDAALQFRKTLDLDPGHHASRRLLAEALARIGDHDAAVVEFEQALAADPSDPDLHNSIGLSLLALGRVDGAIQHFRKTISLRPDGAAGHNNLAIALQSLNRVEEAITHYRRAIAIDDTEPVRHLNLGIALQEIGRIDEACAAFERTIRLAPRNARAYRHLADCKRFSGNEPQIAAMEKLVAQRHTLPEVDQRQLLFALGKVFTDLNQPEKAIGFFTEGNHLKARQMTLSLEEILQWFARIKRVFSQSFINARSRAAYPSEAAIFIVGMPRSGTTLVEQIVASHPRVFGAGELLDLEKEVARACASVGRFPDCVASLSDTELQQIGESYVRSITSRAAGAAHVTDKMPLNFFFIGLIRIILPNARIIHTVRDPLDTCVSCFANLLTGDHRLPCDLNGLGQYHRAYQDLMRHWKDVLPANALLHVIYEDLVTDFEPQARRIIAYCGLDWTDACLNFMQAKRPVRTASVAQVRQPVYRNAIGRWKTFEPWLGPLFQALGQPN